MGRVVNGVLYVNAFTPTENPGEYTFESGLFNNQADITGNGTYDVTVGFVLFVPAVDRNTLTLLPGVGNRYVLTSLTHIDSVRLSGTMLWDSEGEELDLPADSSFCLISQTTNNLKLAIPAIDNIYPDVTSGSSVAAMLKDIINIIDKLSAGAPASQTKITSILPINTNGQTAFTLPFVPKDKTSSVLTINGLKYIYGAGHDFTITDNVLTWTDNSLVLDTTDNMVISYVY